MEKFSKKTKFLRVLDRYTAQRRSARTYRTAIRAYSRFLGGVDEVDTWEKWIAATEDDLVRYRAFCAREYSGATSALYIGIIKRLYHLLFCATIVHSDIGANIRCEKSSIRRRRFYSAIDRDEVRKLLKCKDPRFAAISGLLFLRALRISEVLALRLDDIDLDGGRMLLRSPKESRDIYLRLEPAVAELLRRWIAVRPPEGDRLFPGRQGRPMCPKSVNRWLRARIGATSHSGRVSACTEILAAGASLEAARDHLRHSSVKITEKYDKRKAQDLDVFKLFEGVENEQ